MIITRRTRFILLTVVALGACGAETEAPESEDGPAELAAENERIVLDFIDAWPRLDPAELASFFTEDGVYHNVPTQPVQGRANVEGLIRGFTADWTETSWEVLTLMSRGDTVIAERVDHIVAGDRSVDLPVVGVFELEQGKIKVWRDYFDLGTYTRDLN
jgi:limonene-1,2-epoxide hydrolase